MKNLRIYPLIAILVMMLAAAEVSAQSTRAEYDGMAKLRVQVLADKLNLNELQQERVYNIHLLYAEQLFNELRGHDLELNIDNTIAIMKRESPKAIEEVKAVLNKRQKRIYKRDLKQYK